MCSENSRIYEGLGNLGASSQYKNMSDQCQRDLLAIKGIRTQGLTPPKFTMEMRKFAIVHSNPGMSDKKIEVEVVRGITLPAPSGHNEEDMNVYVEIEFPWPSDSAQKAETDKVAGSSNPEFNSKHQFDIDRKQLRSLQRTFKRHPLKCMVYQYRMLRKNIFIGMVLVPLEALESKCELRVSDDLKDEKGKRPAGGKLELFVRLREPLSGCDQEEKEQKWLVFQESIAAEASVKMLRPAVAASSTSPIKVEQTTSLDALKLELSIVQNALKAGKRDPEIVQRGRAIQAKMQAVKQKLQHPSYKRDYMSAISQEIKAERVIEQDLLRAGNSGQARIIQGRRKVMENEITKLQSK
jgi:coiled-coil and C2 domain-containing protein 1